MSTRKPEILAIVPARGGSKGLPGKNIRHLAGHPLIAFSIAAGLQSYLIDRVICSTDNAQIAQIAESYGAEIPFLRPAELAEDDTSDLPVFKHALQFLEEKESYCPEIVVQIRPTSPIRFLKEIDSAVQKLIDCPKADSLRSICPPSNNPFKMWTINNNGTMSPLLEVEGIDEPYNSPRQCLPQVWWQTGMIDVMRRRTIVEMSSMTGRQIAPFCIDSRYAIDIDNEEGLLAAERLMEGLPCVHPCPKKP